MKCSRRARAEVPQGRQNARRRCSGRRVDGFMWVIMNFIKRDQPRGLGLGGVNGDSVSTHWDCPSFRRELTVECDARYLPAQRVHRELVKRLLIEFLRAWIWLSANPALALPNDL